ncbi:MAG: hypothetical protein EBR73_06650 [Rhodobacteraceae bacterium]|nr:hypothetical protein [Paracoccaceae bacterium]
MRKIPLLAHNVDKRAIAPFGMKTLDGLIQLRSVIHWLLLFIFCVPQFRHIGAKGQHIRFC